VNGDTRITGSLYAGVWQKIHETDLSSVSSYTVSGLNGNTDKIYQIIVKGEVGGGHYNLVRPNNDSGSNYRNADHLAEIGGSNIHGLENPGSSGLGIGRGPGSGRFMSQSYLYAVTGQQRVLIGTAGSDNGSIIQTHTFTSVWTDTGSNISSLVFIFPDGFTGKIIIFAMR